MKKVITWTAAALMTAALTASALAADASHTVAAGDTMWKLASAYQVGTSEIIAANPQVPNPNLIYPGQVLRIPQVPEAVLRYESEVVRLVNAVRAENGLRPLSVNWELARVARYKSEDYGQRTPAAVMDAWMNSSGHRANILNSSYTHIGVGYCERGNYWTQMFMS